MNLIPVCTFCKRHHMPFEPHYPEPTPPAQRIEEPHRPIRTQYDPRESAPILPTLPAPVAEARATRPRLQPTPAQTRVPAAFVAYNRARQIQGQRWHNRIAVIMARGRPRSAREVLRQLTADVLNDTPPPGLRAVQLHMKAIRARFVRDSWLPAGGTGQGSQRRPTKLR
jgi:hypothetical protein